MKLNNTAPFDVTENVQILRGVWSLNLWPRGWDFTTVLTFAGNVKKYVRVTNVVKYVYVRVTNAVK